MISLEVKFAEALAQLKAKASVKLYTEVYAEALKQKTAETKLNVIEAALTNLKESGGGLWSEERLIELTEATSDPAVAVLFGKAPRKVEGAPVTEKKIVRHNGSADNYNESSPFNDERTSSQVVSGRKDPFAKGDRALADGLKKIGKITESNYRKLIGQPSKEVEALSESQRKEFDACRLIGISEADSLTLARMNKQPIQENSRPRPGYRW